MKIKIVRSKTSRILCFGIKFLKMADDQAIEDNKTSGIVNDAKEPLEHVGGGNTHTQDPSGTVEEDGPASKRRKVDHEGTEPESRQVQSKDSRVRGCAPVKAE